MRASSALTLTLSLTLTLWGRSGTLAPPGPGARRRKSVRIDRGIANASPVLVEESRRLLEQPRLRRARRHGCLEDIETILVHVDRDEGTGFIGVVRELDLMSFDEILHSPPELRHLDVPCQDPLRRKVDGAAYVVLPGPGTLSTVVIRSRTGALRVRVALLGSLRVYALGVGVIDHRDGVMARAFVVAAR